ncbi:winged helix-turn-helix domain-containing protein [Reyranella sp.]|uniref:winged helix-turn-helix domain-containing protein n=1 Tax=Reyranella sp. TaxID=1929291 RepID=UPI002F934B68
MTIRNADRLTEMQAKRLQFGRYVLDLDRGGLFLDGTEIALRPKTFAVLRHLVENSGRLVSKDELFDSVWPNLTVTDDALVQSVGELRRALKDDGSRFIRTIPRRGYRFDSEVMPAGSIDGSAMNVASVPAATSDAPRSSSAGIGRRTPRGFLTMALGGSRPALFGMLGLAVLIAAGALWAGAGAGWKFPGLAGRADRSGTGNAEVGARPAVAILPIVNQSGDPARDYFADGLTQDIIGALGRFPQLTVMSWNAVFPYKSSPASPGEIARSLAVRYQVEGGVLQTGDRVRVTEQLVDAQGRVLWSARFDEPLADLFALQDRITAEIAGALAIRVREIEQRRVLAKPTDSLEAYDYVLRARPALQRPTRADIAQARVLLRHAIEIDPNYADAYAALAETYYVATSMGWAEAPTAVLDRAEELANKALSIDDSEVRAHVILGRIHIFHRQYEQAKAEIDRAIAVNANDAHGIAGRGNILMWSGQTEAAIRDLELAQRIDPDLDAMDRFALGLAYYLEGRYDAAIEEAELNLREHAGANFSRVVLAAAYAQDDRTDDAARVVAAIRRFDPTFDARAFGTKFLKPADLGRLRDGLRKAGLDAAPPGAPATGR